MRQIKFRGKSLDTDNWVYGYLAESEELGAYITWMDDEATWHKEQVDPETVGQFVGRQDMNEQDVYEGDIIKTFPDDILGLVYAPFEVKFGSFGDFGNYTGWYIPKDGVIIGNVTDNPELVKGAA